MTITLSPEIESRVKAEASKTGVDANEFVAQLIEEALPRPNQATLDLLAEWDREQATDDPEEIARRQQEGEQFMRNLARNRFDMEGPNARNLRPTDE